MRQNKFWIIFLACVYFIPIAHTQNTGHTLQMQVEVSQTLKTSFQPSGRLFIFLSTDLKSEPRNTSGTDDDGWIFAVNIPHWDLRRPLIVNDHFKLQTTAEWNLQNIPAGSYVIQVLWDHDSLESRINVPGNLYSKPQVITIHPSTTVRAELTEQIPAREIIAHPLVKTFSIQSKILSAWWKKPVQLKTSILLPAGYATQPTKSFPVRYNIAGYGGRYTRVNNLVRDSAFMSWWQSPAAPQIITIFLDGEGPFGDSYQVNSANQGPYGDALINELIPALEQTFRINPEQRYVDGCSTGGWVSLALQLFYPDVFQGCWSYSPDPVDFHHMQLINIYKDSSAFSHNQEFKRPSMRNTLGQPLFSIQQEVLSENVQGRTGTYITSGQQWGSWNAVYSPRGVNGLPLALFHPTTGVINKTTAQSWKNYDLLNYCRENWASLGPKIAGKIYIWMGDMDHFYLNNALRSFKKFIDTTSAPVSDAVIEFTPMAGHCAEYNHRTVLEKIQQRGH